MKKILFIVMLISLFGFSQEGTKILHKNIPEFISLNAKVFIPTSPTDFTSPDIANANKIWEVQTDIDLEGGTFSPPANVAIFLNGGNVLNIGTFVGNNTSWQFITDDSVFDLFSAAVSGTFKTKNYIATNFGAIDDNLSTTDNYQVGKNLLDIANSVGGTLVWNKKDTGKYWASVQPSALDSPFYPTSNDVSWFVGNGNDYVTVKHEAGVEIITITNDLPSTARYIFYNTRGSQVLGGTLRGDRYRHRYNREILVSTAATSASSITLTITVPDPYKDITTLETLVETIPLTLSNANTNASEIADYINTNLGADGYVATATANNVVFYKEGVDFTIAVDAGTTGGVFTLTQSPYEWGHAFFMSSKTFFNKIGGGIVMTEFHGDGISGGQQGNGTSNILTAHLTNGYIDEFGVADNLNTDYYYLTTPRTLPTPHEWFSFAPNAMASVDLLHYKYWMLYYDVNDNFIEKSPTLIPYESYYPRVMGDDRPAIAKYRILVENNGTNISDFYYFVNSRSYAIGNVYEDFEISHTRRQGISNPGIDFTIRNFIIRDVGGQEPQFALDIEDDHKHPMGWMIDKGHFWNNANGDIIVKGASNGTISNCFHKQDSWNPRFQDSKGLALDTGYGRQLKIYGNTYEHKKVHLDINMNFYGNNLFYSKVYARQGGSLISGNYLINSSVNDGTKVNETNSQSAGGNSLTYVYNNIFKINDGWTNDDFIVNTNNIIWNNNRYEFNDKVTNHGAIADESLRTVVINDTGDNRLRADKTTTLDNKGTSKGTVVTGLSMQPSNLHRLGWPEYASNLEDFKIEGSLRIWSGIQKDFKIRNGEVSGWLNLELTQWLTDGVSAFNTIKVKDVDIRVPIEIDANEGHLNNTQYGGANLQALLRTKLDANLNLVFNDCTFIMDDTSTGLFMYLGHRGYTKFINCTFIGATSQTIDFTSSGAFGIGVHTGTNTGPITNINPTVDNVSFVYRAGDTEVTY